MPDLVDGRTWPYVALGTGYAVASLVMFGLGALRRRAVERALAAGTYAELAPGWTLLLSLGGACLALATLLVVLLA